MRRHSEDCTGNTQLRPSPCGSYLAVPCSTTAMAEAPSLLVPMARSDAGMQMSPGLRQLCVAAAAAEHGTWRDGPACARGRGWPGRGQPPTAADVRRRQLLSSNLTQAESTIFQRAILHPVGELIQDAFCSPPMSPQRRRRTPRLGVFGGDPTIQNS